MAECDRWLVLIAYILVGSTQGLVWTTYSSSFDEAVKLYNWTHLAIENASNTLANMPGNGVDATETVDLLLNWGPIMYIIFVLPVMWFLNRGSHMLWRVSLAGAILTTLGSLARLVPTVLGLHYTTQPSAVMWLHIGQALNGMAAPTIATTTSALSAIWFPPEQRTMATALAYLPNVIGPAAGFLIGQAVTTPEHLPVVLILEAISAILVLLLWSFVPALPKHAPSHSAAEKRRSAKEKSLVDCSNFCSSVCSVVQMPSVLLIVVAGGVVNGVFYCWSVSIIQILQPLGFGEVFATWMGFILLISGFLGNVAVPTFVGRVCPRRLKLACCLLYVVQLFTYAIFCFSTPIASMEKSLLPPNRFVLTGALLLASFCAGGVFPLFYEMMAEITYPADESVAGGVLSLFNNAGGLVILFMLPLAPAGYDSIIMGVVVLVGTVLFLFVRVDYKRSRADFDAKSQRTGMKAMLLP